MRSVLISWQIKVTLQYCRVVFTATFLSRMLNNDNRLHAVSLWENLARKYGWAVKGFSRWNARLEPRPRRPCLRQCRASGWPGRPAPWAAPGRAGRHGCCTWRWCHWCRTRAGGKSKTAEERTRVSGRAALNLKPLLHAMKGLFESTSENQYSLNRERLL